MYKRSTTNIKVLENFLLENFMTEIELRESIHKVILAKNKKKGKQSLTEPINTQIQEVNDK